MKKPRDMLTQSYLIYHGLAASVAEKKLSENIQKNSDQVGKRPAHRIFASLFDLQ